MKIQLHICILTFMRWSRFTSPVATLIESKQAGTFKPDLSVMAFAIQYCTEAGLGRQLSRELRSAGMFGQYELFVALCTSENPPCDLDSVEELCNFDSTCVSHMHSALNRTNMLSERDGPVPMH